MSDGLEGASGTEVSASTESSTTQHHGGEGCGGSILSFQALSSRKRVNVTEAGAAASSVTVKVFAFDLLLLNGASLGSNTYRERRALMRASFQCESDQAGLFGFATTRDFGGAGGGKEGGDGGPAVASSSSSSSSSNGSATITTTITDTGNGQPLRTSAPGELFQKLSKGGAERGALNALSNPLGDWLRFAVDSGVEGLMCKRLDAPSPYVEESFLVLLHSV